jgi:pectate lyase
VKRRGLDEPTQTKPVMVCDWKIAPRVSLARKMVPKWSSLMRTFRNCDRFGSLAHNADMESLRKHLGVGLVPAVVLFGTVACSGSDDGAVDNPQNTSPMGGGATTGGTNATGGVSTVPKGNGGTVSSSSTTAASGGQGGNTANSSTAGAANVGGFATGGASVTGGTSATGGKSSTGGTSATGGKSSTGGTSTTGGTSSTGGTSATGGTSSTGGTSATGGSQGTCTIPPLSNTPIGYGASVTGGGNNVAVEVNTREALVAAIVAYKKGTAGLVLKYTGKFDYSTITDPCTQHSKTAQVVDIKDLSNLTIIGAPGSSANFGLHFMRVSNIIIRNMKFGLLPGGGSSDVIGIEGASSKFWIDHNELFSSMVECAGAGDSEFDGLLDIKDGSHDMTFSYNYFHDHHKVGLMGSSDSDAFDWRVTLHHNRYDNIGSRTPLQRGGTTHIYNNYYNNVMVTGANIRMSGISLIESNYFENSKNPVTARDSTAIGFWDLRNNFVGSAITWTAASDEPYVNATDWKTSKAFTATLGYAYTADPAACVKAIVTATAGAKL